MTSSPAPVPVGGDVPPGLAAFLAERREQLTRWWIEAVRQAPAVGAAAAGLDDVELADHLPRLFADLEARLRGEDAAERTARHAGAHGEHRWRQGYRLEEVLHELGVVHRTLLRHGLDAFETAHPDGIPREQLHAAREHFLGFFEEAAAGSVRRYAEHSRQQVNDLHAQVRETDRTLSEQRRLALDAARMGWWHYDLLRGKVRWDERFREICGVGEDELDFDRALALTHPDDRARVADAVAAATRARDPVPYATEHRLRRPDGAVRWVAARGRATFEGQGAERRAVSFVGTLADVTEERQTTEALRANEAKYRSLFNSIDTGFCVLEMIWDTQGRATDYRFAEVNPAFEGQTGLRAVTGRTARELIPGLEEHWFEIYGRVARTGEPHRFEQGSAAMGRWFDVYAFALGAATAAGEGSARPVAVLFNDVSERRRAESALRESEERFRQLADVMPQIVWAARPDGVLDYTNRRWGEYVQQTEAEMAPADWHQRVHPDDLPSAAVTWARAVTSGQPYATEFRLRRGDGVYRWFLVRALPIRDGDGTITRWYGTCTDIDDQRALLEQNAQLLDSERAARAEAERTGRMKDEFLATLGHELRTPLNAILGWSTILRGEALTDDVAEGLAIIERNARAQTRIIEDLLDMSRIISGKVRLDVQRLDLAAVLAAAVETIRPAANAKGLRLQTVLDPGARWVSGDPNRLQQVFWNLLSNAVKFTPKGGQVRVVLECVHSHLEVSVSDSGEGIAPEFLPHVFDRFRQADASTTRHHGGLGLGLAIVKQLVELHGGTVRAGSAGVGQGTSFRVMLPLRALRPEDDGAAGERRHPRAGAADAPPPPLSEQLPLRGVNVLVVDDEADARTLIRRLLEDREANVRTAGSAAEAMALFLAERPDVLVSDIGMPGEDGYALIGQVRALGPGQGGATPALALTAYARSEDRLKALLAGFQMHLAKPVETLELLATVASLAGRVAGR